MCYTYDSLNRVTKRTTKNLSNVVLSEESYSYGMDYAMAYVLSEEVNTVSYIFFKDEYGLQPIKDTVADGVKKLWNWIDPWK